MERVHDLRDTEQLRKDIENMNGSLNLGSSPTKSRGVPALDFSMKQVRDMHAAAQSGHFLKADVDSTDAPMAAVGDYRMTPFVF